MPTDHSPAPVALLVEDEPHIRRFVRSALEKEGCQVWEAATLERGLIEVASRHPDLLILDLGLPDGDGIELVRALRGWASTPVLILSARSDEANKVQALDAGADDYLTKPFGVPELLARVRALLRRSQCALEASPVLRFGNIELDLSRRQVMREGQPIPLARRTGSQRRPRANPAPVARRSVGPQPHRTRALLARLHDQPAPQARTRPRPPPASAD